ncbi:hypothetical protein Tcan_07253 [Toxocara canis]|nr:hypothetical protein Tcan_07253 [Toxocara canis]
MSLRDLLNYLRLSIHHQFRELSAKTILIIANSHYNKFVRDYNSNSTGERLEMYRALKESTIATEGNVIEKIKSVFNTGRRTRRILRYNTFECPV